MSCKTILSSKKIWILGFWKEWQEFKKFLELNNYTWEIIIFDNSNFSNLKINNKKNSEFCDFYFKSPWISRHIFPEIQKKFEEWKIFSWTEIFLNFLSENKNIFPNYKTIWITWTKWKSTISSLLFHCLKNKFSNLNLEKNWEENWEENIELLGNIWVPALSYLNKILEKNKNISENKNKIFILELSSYQVEDLNPEKKLDFWLLINIFPDHLDYHKWFENYQKAKENILKISKNFFIWEKFFLENKKNLENFLQNFWKIFNEKKIKLKWEHNKKNIFLISHFLKENFWFSEIELKKSIEKFQPLKHRMEEFRHLNRLWINDAISTTPDSTIQCFNTYQNRINWVILWWQDRWYNFENLIENLSNLPNLKAISLFENSEKILDLIEKKFTQNNKNFPKIFISNDLEKITKFLFENSEKQWVITLSCASPSYWYFKNFEEKWEKFLESIKKI